MSDKLEEAQERLVLAREDLHYTASVIHSDEEMERVARDFAAAWLAEKLQAIEDRFGPPINGGEHAWRLGYRAAVRDLRAGGLAQGAGDAD